MKNHMIIKIKFIFFSFFLALLVFFNNPVYAVTYQEVQEGKLRSPREGWIRRVLPSAYRAED